MKPPADILRIGRNVLQMESQAVAALIDKLDDAFVAAVDLIYHCAGRVVVAGSGKSGQISRKIAGTLASTGTPALYLPPGDALHGDLGMVAASDVFLAVSNRGETEDLLGLMPSLEALQVPVVAILGKTDSSLGVAARIVLDAGVEREACPMDLAPTTSSTAALAMGDALAMALLDLRDFKPEDFARYHPGGTLGRNLLTTVASLMHAGADLPLVEAGSAMEQAIATITAKGLGITGVVDGTGRLVGAITDGDLRRAIQNGDDLRGAPVDRYMSAEPKHIGQSALAVTALAAMEDHAITALFVTADDDSGSPVGLVHIHDILRSGIRR